MTKKRKDQHFSEVASQGCIACEIVMGIQDSPAEIAHVCPGGRRRDDRFVIPLCAPHHRTGGLGVAVHSGRKSWEQVVGHTEVELMRLVYDRLGKTELLEEWE